MSTPHPAAMVYRVADRVAARMGKEPVARKSAGCAEEMLGVLDGVIAWCEPMMPPGTTRVKRVDAA